MEDNNLEVLLDREISDDSSNQFIDLDNSICTDLDNSISTDLDDSIFNYLNSKIENLIFICPECSDSPRITP